ncbi:universal stress protein [Haladaptatus caseinilyticus]|uniref:universal stress protein n=1 Tax=Haladaptatus caseinilyticus TaxID=2993314 RepID=UPI00224B2925|nr:universal stress protein [Haladaptatus caseinilyticus]
MFDRILIPIDGSDCAERAAKYGLELGKTYGAAVAVLHVLEQSRFRRLDSDTQAERSERGSELVAEVETLADEVGVSIDSSMAEGKPHEIIDEHVAESDTDLVVMGRRGRSSMRGKLLGSVTDRVLRTVDVPVFTVPEGDISSETGTTYERILLPTDGSTNAEGAARYGADIANRYDSTVHVFNAVDVQREGGLFSAGGVSEEFIERLEEQGTSAVERLARRIRETDSDIDLDLTVVRDAPTVGIRDYVTDEHIDLVVMASHGEANLSGQLLGSVTDSVLGVVDAPVLVITRTAETA